jgi:hypothetical protein
MSDYNVSVTITVGTWPGNGGTITNYSMTADLSGLPAGFATSDSTGKFTVGFKIRGSRGVIFSPLQPGDKITFTFGSIANSGLAVANIAGLGAGALTWQHPNTNPNNGTTSVIAVVTGAPVSLSSDHSEYTVTMQRGSEVATIDPDFETDVTAGSG